MIKPILKNVFSPNIPDLEKYEPEQDDCFMIQLWLDIGANDSDATDIFYLTVCTPEWLKNECTLQALWGRHLLIVSSYDIQIIRDKIEDYLSTCTGNDWQQLAVKIGKICAWEFEDYQA
ncbi:MAG: immunity 8 family protein [Alphaproteobacteria bacterium]|nr:immunity 8 family protein [Alphaproteobacteria bacterium]